MGYCGNARLKEYEDEFITSQTYYSLQMPLSICTGILHLIYVPLPVLSRLHPYINSIGTCLLYAFWYPHSDNPSSRALTARSTSPLLGSS